MSMAAIIEELPRLSHHERRQLGQRLITLETGPDELAICNATAGEGFTLLDQMEAEETAPA